MNDRIAAIDKSAQEYAGRIVGNDEDSNYTEWFNVYKEKFATLIVTECADEIQRAVSMKYKDGGETEEFMGGHYAGSVLARVKIKSYFGIKE